MQRSQSGLVSCFGCGMKGTLYSESSRGQGPAPEVVSTKLDAIRSLRRRSESAGSGWNRPRMAHGVPPNDAIYPLLRFDGVWSGLTATMADRAVPIELTWFLVVIRSQGTLPQEHAAALSAAPPCGSRGAGQGIREQRRDRAVLHAEGKDAGGCAGGKSVAGCAEWRKAGPRAEGAGRSGCRLAAGPIGPSRRPAEGWTRRDVQRGRALSRLSHSLGDRSGCPGSCGGISGVSALNR